MPEETSDLTDAPLPSKEALLAILAEGKMVVHDGRTAHDEAGVDFILSCYAPQFETPEAPQEPEVPTEEVPVAESVPEVPEALQEPEAQPGAKAKGK